MAEFTQRDINHDDDIIKTEDGLIFNPYNPLNIKITKAEVEAILVKYGIPPMINNMALYERAFVHRSYTKRPNFENIQQNITIVERPPDCMPLSSKSNERLEFLGDGVLELVTKYYLYRRFPKENEGFMTEKKISYAGDAKSRVSNWKLKHFCKLPQRFQSKTSRSGVYKVLRGVKSSAAKNQLLRLNST